MPFDDDPDDELSGSGPPLPPEDRLWRHPSELGLLGAGPPGAPGLVVAPPSPAARRPLWPLAAASGLAGALLAVGAVALLTDGLGTRVVERVVERLPVSQTMATLDVGNGPSVVDVAERVSPAVARIETDGGEPASGVLYRAGGFLLTNAHVVGTADEVTVVLADGSVRDGEVLGHDDDTDLAVVRVDGTGLPAAVLGTALGLRVGETAVAVGGPSVTAGVVSAVGRRVDRSGAPPLHDMIEIDAPVLPSASGGALVGPDGAVIGITTAVDGGAGGMGFAVPIDVATAVGDDIVRTGHVDIGWLGVQGMDQPHGEQGALVHSVVDDSPASRAGLGTGDVLVAVDGRPVASMSDLVVALRSYDPGDEVAVTYQRDGRRHTVRLRLADAPLPG